MELVIYTPSVSPLMEMVKLSRGEVEGPAGENSFRCWNLPLKFEWLEKPVWCVLCGASVPNTTTGPHRCIPVR